MVKMRGIREITLTTNTNLSKCSDSTIGQPQAKFSDVPGVISALMEDAIESGVQCSQLKGMDFPTIGKTK